MDGPGLTGRVFRGGVVSIAGQVVVLVAAFIATPIVIRGLGAEAYGVFALVNVILGYLAFADFGMGTATTTFASQVHARGDDDGERAVIVTGMMIAGIAAAVVAAGLAVSAPLLANRVLGVPPALRRATAIALQLAAVGLFARCLINVLNTPQLVRLRMNVYATVNTAGSLLQILLVPVLVVLGYGLVGAVAGLVAAVIVLSGMHLVVSNRLLPGMLLGRTDAALAWRTMRFGGALVVSMAASVTLMHSEKLFLAHYSSAAQLAYYAVAFNVASVLSVAPQAVGASLLPAFAQLRGADDRVQLATLFDRAVRGALIYAVPAVIILATLGGSFLAAWAGPDFARGGRGALVLLAVGFGVNALAYIPYFVMLASGRSDLIARLHVAELVPYLILVVVLVGRYGAIGAGWAWAIRSTADAIAMFWLARREAGVSPAGLFRRWPGLLAGLAALAIPALAGAAAGPVAAAAAVAVALPAYAAASFAWILDDTERLGVRDALRRAGAFVGFAPRS